MIATALNVLSGLTPSDLASLNAGIDEGLADIDRGDVYTEEEARAYLRAMSEKL